jgi:ubiquinone/menaquinone biosynthesis C-methylase UbiE
MQSNAIYTDGQYLDKNPDWHVGDSHWKAQQVMRCIRKNNLNPKSVCEIGCGAGEILRYMHSNSSDEVEFTGYEVSPQAFELCRTRTQPRLNFLLQDLLTDDSQVFDIGLCLDVFEHVPDYLGFLAEFRRKARFKIFHIPLEISVSTVLRKSIFATTHDKFGHLHRFTKDLALAALTDSGYKILDCSYTSYYVDRTREEIMKSGLKSLLMTENGWKSILMSPIRKLAYRVSPDWTTTVLGGYSLLVLAE